MILSLYFWNHIRHRRESWNSQPSFDHIHPEQSQNILEMGDKLPARVQWLDSIYDADGKCVTAPLKAPQNNHL